MFVSTPSPFIMPSRKVAERYMIRHAWFFDRKPPDTKSRKVQWLESAFSRERLGSIIRSGGLRGVLVGDVTVVGKGDGGVVSVILYYPEDTPDPTTNPNWLPPNRSRLILRSIKSLLPKFTPASTAVSNPEVTVADFEMGDAYCTYLLTMSVSFLDDTSENRVLLGYLKNR